MAGRNNSLPRRLSLKSRVEIAHLLRFGLRYPGKFCTLVFMPHEQFRYGIFFQRGYGSARSRNRIKRLFREAVRLEVRPRIRRGKVGILPEPIEPAISSESIRTDVSHILNALDDNA